MARYDLVIYLRGSNQGAVQAVQAVNGAIKDLTVNVKVAGQITGSFGTEAKENFEKAAEGVNRFQGQLHEVARVAAGVLLRDAIRGLYHSILDIAGAAFSGYMNVEQLTLALEALATKQLSMGQAAEVAYTSIYHLTDADILKLQDLQYEYDLTAAKVVYLNEKLADATEKYGANSYQALALAADLRETQAAATDLATQISNLNAKDGALITTTEEVTVGQMSHNKAMELAVPLAKELATWIETLSLTRPLFSEQVTSNALQLAAAFNFTLIYAHELTDEFAKLKQAQLDGVVTAQRLVLALQDFVSASGFGGDTLERLIVALGQVKAKGKLAAEEVRQFVNAGLGMDTMARAMGMSIGEFQAALQAGQISAEDFILAIVSLFEKDFGGAAEGFSDKLVGIKQGFTNLVTILGRHVVSPFLDTLLPMVSKLYKHFASQDFRDVVTHWAEGLNEGFKSFIRTLRERIGEVKKQLELFNVGEITLKQLVIRFAKIFFPDLVKDLERELKKLMDVLEPLADLNLGFEDNIVALKTFVKDIVLWLGGAAVLGVIGFILTLFGEIAAAIGGIGLAVALAHTAWTTNWNGIRDKLTAVYEKIKPQLDELRIMLEEKLVYAIKTLRVWFYNDFIPALEDTATKLQSIFNVENLIEQRDKFLAFFEETKVKLKHVLTPIRLLLESVFTVITSSDNISLPDIIGGLADELVKLKDSMQDEGWHSAKAPEVLETLYDAVSSLTRILYDNRGTFDVALDFLQGVEDFGNAFIGNNAFTLIGDMMLPLIDSVSKFYYDFKAIIDLVSNSPAAAERGSKFFDIIEKSIRMVSPALRLMLEIYILLVTAVLEVAAVIGNVFYTTLKTVGQLLVKTFIDPVLDKMRWLLLLIATYLTDVKDHYEVFHGVAESLDLAWLIDKWEAFLTFLITVRDTLKEIVDFLANIANTDLSGLPGGGGGGGSMGSGGGGAAGGGGSGAGGGGSSGGGGGGNGSMNAPLVGTMVINNPAAATVVMQQLRNARSLRAAGLVA